MRGTPIPRLIAEKPFGIIPAYAGNTMTVRRFIECARDHPRICGEHYGDSDFVAELEGSSPHMRGTPSNMPSHHHAVGIIPAYAGNTIQRPAGRMVERDHPRICGEHSPSVSRWLESLGSSPHMRGTPPDMLVDAYLIGIIPAYAGNTACAHLRYCPRRDHPRICGEHIKRKSFPVILRGSSPHMRGTLKEFVERVDGLGIIPAYAGNTLRDYSNFVVSKFMSFVFHLV